MVSAAEAMVADGLDSPTEFEVVTAIAFLYFADRQADITILEVGLGGIGDSTNVVKSPLASVITSISYDHMAQLGSSLAEIAVNKAGIIKTGCPVIANVPQRDAAKIIARKAYAMGSRLYDISGIRAAVSDETPFSQKVSMELYEKSYSDVEISMVGRHQAENLKTALATLEILRKSGAVKLDREALYEGLKRARQPGRFEVISEDPLAIIDGAHNEGGRRLCRKPWHSTLQEKDPARGRDPGGQRNRFNSKVSDENHRSYHRDGAGQSAKAGGRKAGGACGGLWHCGGGRFGCRDGGASCKGAGGRLRRDPVCGIAVSDRRCTEVMEK